MFNLFRSNKQPKEQFLSTWRPIMHQAMTKMPEKLPELARKNAKLFIDEWNLLYENANENDKIGLAVLAYRVDIHRYAAAMLIDGDSNIRLSGIRLLGYMRDETAWKILAGLLNHTDKTVALTALVSLFQINERRARDELSELIVSRDDWSREFVLKLLEPICNTDFLAN
ncbi:MAG: HEAT repeat domain-containing protein [Gammaproteobacteria bacterium]|nr:HEAT repeat domain-containing protein [Gammaproteobacteria bacterium]